MSYAAIVLIGFGILALVLIVLFELAQILSEGGAKLLLWPRLNHGYEVAPVTRLASHRGCCCCSCWAATAPASCCSARPARAAGTRYVPWLIAAWCRC